MKPSIVCFIILFPLVGLILLFPLAVNYEQTINDPLVTVMQGLSVLMLILVGVNAFDDLKSFLKQ